MKGTGIIAIFLDTYAENVLSYATLNILYVMLIEVKRNGKPYQNLTPKTHACHQMFFNIKKNSIWRITIRLMHVKDT